MEDVDALLTELARSHGEEILGLRWGAVLAACESEPEREACRLLGRNDVRLDRALKTLRAVNVYASLDREERAHVNAVIRRAFARDRGEDTAAPDSWEALRAWVEEQDLTELAESCVLWNVPGMATELGLAGPYHEMAGLNLATLLVCHESLLAQRLLSPRTLGVVRAFLLDELRHREAEGPRRARWAQPVEGEGLADLAEGLKRLHEDMPSRRVHDHTLSGVEMWVDAPAMELCALVEGGRFNTVSEITVSIVRRDAKGRPAVTATSAVYAPHTHNALAAVVAHWRDVVHDPTDPLHAEVAEVANRPRWAGLLADLVDALETPSEPTKPERVVWRIHGSGVDITVEPAIQKLGKKGWSKGKRSTPESVERREPLDPLDMRVIVGHSGRAGDLIESLVGHPRVILADDPDRGVKVVERGVSVELSDETPRFLYLRVGSERVDAASAFSRFVRPNHYVWLDRETATLSVARVPEPVIAMLARASEWGIGLPAEADEVMLDLLARLPAEVGLRLPSALAGTTVEPDRTPRLALELHGSGALEVGLQLSPLDDAKRFRPGAGPVLLSGARAGGRVSTTRDFAAELQESQRWVEALGLAQARELGRFRFAFDDLGAALDFLDRAQERADEVRLEWAAGQRLRVRGSVGKLKVTARESRDWFVLDADTKVDEERVTLAALRRAIDRGERYVKLGRGEFAKIEESLRAQLAELSNVSSERGGEVVVRKEAAPSVERILADSAHSSLATSRAWKAQLKRIRDANDATPRKPSGLKVKLRDYQRDGVRWLLRLSKWSGGCCLADEMGLGKTVQALALLAARAKGGPALVIAPTSLAYNWRDEAARFAPRLDVRIYRNADRAALLEGLGPGTVLVTSYDLMARDADALSPIRWETAIFDEAHALKNPKTQRAEAARRLDAGFRVALTGTPVENHLGELWALFDVIVPGLLGDFARFKRRFVTPIQVERDQGQQAALRAIVSPFLLRRTKALVAEELPPRTDIVRTVELSPEEMARYELERREALEALSAVATDPTARFAMLAALTRLRRLACHPALVDETAPARSSKLDATLELLDELREADHRALVFSQFTSHLALLRRELDRRGVPYLYLDGSTPASERAKLVERFQSGAQPYFLISLKAGGTGLNLTAADTVVHLDPWWNPAVEDQASDRAHRIGQDQPVTVIRLIAQGTIEDKVLALHAEKRELAEGLLEGSEANVRLDTAELITLLES